MLSIGKLAAGQADYYLQQAGRRVSRCAGISSGVEDYYLGGPEADGEWVGSASRLLGLAGTVEDDALHAVLSGRSPQSGEQLPSRALRVPGFDATFSAPKSVSLLFALGDEPTQAATREAHDKAVRSALAYLERNAAFSRRGFGGHTNVKGEGFIAAAFRHRTSRAGDPQLHTHVLVANLTRLPDGRWQSLDGRRLYGHARTAGFLYEFRLRAELTKRMGVGWGEIRNGLADVDGVEPPVLRAFSRRRAEIEAELERVGHHGAAAAQVAALETRHGKDYGVTPEALLPEWRERARALGLDEEALRQLEGRRGLEHVDESTLSAISRRLSSPEGMTRDRSTFATRDAVRAWCEALPAGTDLSITELETVVAAALTQEFLEISPVATFGDDAIRLQDGRIVSAPAGDPRYTTADLLLLEREIIALASGPAGNLQPEPPAVEAALRARPALAREQVEMVRRLVSDTRRVTVVVGKAGAGKTFALDAARSAWERSGIEVVGAAVARRAARELEEGAGIVSTSVAGLLLDLRRGGGYGLRRGCVVVIDEASLLGTRDLAEVLRHVADARGKLVLVGDHRQLPAIQAGGAFLGLVNRLDAIKLDENRRQESPWERQALDELREGDVDEAIRAYAVNDRLVVAADAQSVRDALVCDWWADGADDDAVMIAFRRSDVRDLNHAARARMAEAGRLGPTAIELGGPAFAVGDRVVLRRNDRRRGVANGDRGVIIGIDANRQRVSVALRGRRVRRVTLAHDYLSCGRGPAIVHGYAVTGHVAQGMTVDRALVLGTEALFREWGYVALSRGRADNRFYAVVGEATDRDEIAPRATVDDPLQVLADALGRSQAELMATDSGTLSSKSTDELHKRAGTLRKAGAASTISDARRLAAVRAELERLDAGASTSDVVVGSRRALLYEQLAELEASAIFADPSSAIELVGIESELLDRQRLADRAVALDPPGAAIASLGPRPERPSGLRRWRRNVRLARARDLGHTFIDELRR